MRKLDEIVREYMIEIKGSSQVDNSYPRLLQIAITGMKDINRAFKEVVKVKRIDVSESNFTAALPPDYINYRRIGICSNGKIFALGVNNEMCPGSYDDCGNLEIEGQVASGVEVDQLVFTNAPAYNEAGRFTGGLFGIGGGNNQLGYYRIFANEGYIAFQNVNQSFSEIILEYYGDTNEIDGEFYVHSSYVEAVKAFITWKLSQGRSGMPSSEKEYNRRMYNLEKNKGAMQVHAFTVNELMQAMNSGYRSSPSN